MGKLDIYAVNPADNLFIAAASLTSSPVQAGWVSAGLSQDDMGGLRHLLTQYQVCCENLLPDVHAAPDGPTNLVGMAYRPGVEKILFLRHPFAPATGQFLPFTNRWTDLCYVQISVLPQPVERVCLSMAARSR